jgi:hypothetical protein
MSFVYLNVLLKLDIYLVCLPNILKMKSLERSRRFASFTLMGFVICAAKGVRYKAVYSSEGRKMLEEMRADLGSL